MLKQGTTVGSIPNSDMHEAGSGTPLVLLHGMGGTWRNWNPVLHLLAQKHRVIAITLPGHDGGAPLRGKPSIATLADQLIEELQARGIERAHVAGNSLGGWLAVELARRGFALSVVALSPAGAWRDQEAYDRLAKAVSLGAKLLPVMYAALWIFMGFGWGRRVIFKDNMAHGERVPTTDFRAMLRGVMRCKMLPELLESVALTGQVQRLEQSTIPVCIAWCGADRVLGFEAYGRPFLDRIGTHKFILVENVGHVPMYDDPEAVAAVITKTTLAKD